MMMYNPELYQKAKTLQTEDTINFLERNINKMKWNNLCHSIIDLGSGDGGTTKNVLKTYIPHNFKKLVGCDKSEEMVNFSNLHHGDERTSFIVLDIEEYLPKQLAGCFNHVFSFNAIHWSHNHKVTFSNIYSLLEEGGDCLLMFLAYMPLYDGFRALSNLDKWKLWLKDVERFVTIYQDTENPESEVREIMVKTGFKIIEVKVVDAIHLYRGEEYFKKSIEAVNPFKIPSHLQEEFLNVFLATALKMKIVQQVDNGLLLKYKHLEVFGTK